MPLPQDPLPLQAIAQRINAMSGQAAGQPPAAPLGPSSQSTVVPQAPAPQQGMLAKLIAMLTGKGQPLPMNDPLMQQALGSMPKVGEPQPFLNAKHPVDTMSPVGTAGIPPALMQALMGLQGGGVGVK